VEPVTHPTEVAEPSNGLGPAHYRPNRAARRGFVRQQRIYKLVFADDEMAGLEVRARGVPLGTFLELIDLASVFDGLDDDTTNLTPEEAGKVRQLFEAFGGVLVSWNLEQPELDADGEETGASVPVPATLAGLYTQDMAFVFQVIQAWMGAIASVAGPLGPPSAGGAPSLEASMPMAVSSPSQAS
jgi:hypothetical protein